MIGLGLKNSFRTDINKLWNTLFTFFMVSYILYALINFKDFDDFID